jgi:hypothetical protein
MSTFFRFAFLACTFGLVCGPLQSMALAQANEHSALKTAERLKSLAGEWEVYNRDDGGETIVPAKLLGLKKGDVFTIQGNELRFGEKLLATLTTDFSANRLELDKAVHVSCRPILLTLPSGKGLLCAYELEPEQGFVLVHPHTMGRISAGTWLYVNRVK